MKAVFLFFALTLSFGLLAQTPTDLEYYRLKVREAAPNEATNWSDSSSEQLNRLFDLMGSQRFEFDPALHAETEEAYVRPLKRGDSSFIKKAIESAVEALVTEERYNTPAVFDPSLFSYEMEERKRKARFAIFQRELVESGDFERLIDALYVNFVRSKSKANQPGTESEYEAQATQRVREILESAPTATALKLPDNPREAAEEFEYSLFDILGDFKQAEYQAGRIRRLIFVDENDASTKISLSMLITFRTGEDGYFVLANDFLATRAQEIVESYYKRNSDGAPVMKKDRPTEIAIRKFKDASDEARYRKYSQLLPQLKADHENAALINARLSRLSADQIHFLIALLLSLQEGDLPAPGETVYLEESYSFGRLIAEESVRIAEENKGLPQDERSDFSENLGVEMSQANTDWVAYKDIEEQLYKLEEFLNEEKGAAPIHNDRIRRISK